MGKTEYEKLKEQTKHITLATLVKKVVVYLILALLWFFIGGKISDFTGWLYKDELNIRYGMLNQVMQGIVIMGTNEPLNIALKTGWRDNETVWAEGRFEAQAEGKDVVRYYRKMLLANGWSDIKYFPNINKSTGKLLQDIYISEKGNYKISFSFPFTMKNPEDITGEYDPSKPYKGLKTEYFIYAWPKEPESLPQFDRRPKETMLPILPPD